MKDKELTMTLTLTVSGGEGWQKSMRDSLEGIGQLVEGANMIYAKGDGANHSFEYKIGLSDGKQYDCPACGSHLIFESDVADLRNMGDDTTPKFEPAKEHYDLDNTFGLSEPDFDRMLRREKR
jgi:hypothetical protein